MFQDHLGEIISLGTAICWTVTALAFQQATRKVGSLSVNIIRLLIAFVIYALVSFFVRGRFFPTDASQFNWIWLSISGLVGFVFGDYFLFKSYEYITARISMLVFSLSPPIAAIISWMILGETMELQSLFAMAVTMAGIILVVTKKKTSENKNEKKRNNLKFAFPVKGLLFAFLGTIGQSTGLVLSKYGMGDYDVFAATQIRIIAASIGFVILISLIKRWGKVKEASTNIGAMKFITIGAIFGPFIGVYLSLLALKFTSVGIASTLMAIIPVLIIPPAIFLYKEKVSLKEFIGALITVGGVVLFFI